ncbi:Gram-negative bacterial tonB protein [compost metagenome]
MGFDIKSESSNDERQLSLLDFQMSQSNFQESSGSSAMDYESFALAHREPETSKAGRFMTLSATVHIAAILIIAVMTVPLIEQTKVETITIEIEEPPQILPPRGAYVQPTQGGTPEQVLPQELPAKEVAVTPAPAVKQEASKADDVIVAAPKAPEEKVAPLPAKAPKAAATAKAKAAPAAAAPAKSSVAAKTTFKAVPATIDDLDAPTLDEGALAAATVKSSLDEDFNEDFSNVDHSQKAALANEKAKMDSMAATMAADQEEELNALAQANQAEAEQLAAAKESLRERNAKAIAAAVASENAAAERAAAARRAQEEADARAAAQAAALARANQMASGNGNGAGNNGSPTHGTQVAGVPQGVRSLDQLRQMPGNPRPTYDAVERRQGHAGNVAFLAYISKEGTPTHFKQLKSTGYENLDAKTLNALKKWRFYPGQEGWVELPFKWDLKGGAQEDGGLLRRAVSQM